MCEKCHVIQIYQHISGYMQYSYTFAFSQYFSYTVQHKTLAGENFGGFGGFPVNRQSFIRQIL